MALSYDTKKKILAYLNIPESQIAMLNESDFYSIADRGGGIQNFAPPAEVSGGDGGGSSVPAPPTATGPAPPAATGLAPSSVESSGGEVKVNIASNPWVESRLSQTGGKWGETTNINGQEGRFTRVGDMAYFYPTDPAPGMPATKAGVPDAPEVPAPPTFAGDNGNVYSATGELVSSPPAPIAPIPGVPTEEQGIATRLQAMHGRDPGGSLQRVIDAAQRSPEDLKNVLNPGTARGQALLRTGFDPVTGLTKEDISGIVNPPAPAPAPGYQMSSGFQRYFNGLNPDQQAHIQTLVDSGQMNPGVEGEMMGGPNYWLGQGWTHGQLGIADPNAPPPVVAKPAEEPLPPPVVVPPVFEPEPDSITGSAITGVQQPIVDNTPNPNAFQPVAETIPAPTEVDGATPLQIGGNTPIVQPGPETPPLAPATTFTPFTTPTGDAADLPLAGTGQGFPEGPEDPWASDTTNPPPGSQVGDEVWVDQGNDIPFRAEVITDQEGIPILYPGDAGYAGPAKGDGSFGPGLPGGGNKTGSDLDEIRNEAERNRLQKPVVPGAEATPPPRLAKVPAPKTRPTLPSKTDPQIEAENAMLKILADENDPNEINAAVKSYLGLQNLPLQQYHAAQFPEAVGDIKNLYDLWSTTQMGSPVDLPAVNAPVEYGAGQVYGEGADASKWMQYAMDQIDKTNIPLENLRGLAGEAAGYMESRTGDLVNPYRADLDEQFAQAERDLRERMSARGMLNSSMADEAMIRLNEAKARAMADADLKFYQGVGPERRADIGLTSDLLTNLFGQQMAGSQFALDRSGQLIGATGAAEGMDLARRGAEFQRLGASAQEDQRAFQNLLQLLGIKETIPQNRFATQMQPLSMLMSALSGTNVAPGVLPNLQVTPWQPSGMQQFGNLLGGLVGDVGGAYAAKYAPGLRD